MQRHSHANDQQETSLQDPWSIDNVIIDHSLPQDNLFDVAPEIHCAADPSKPKPKNIDLFDTNYPLEVEKQQQPLKPKRLDLQKSKIACAETSNIFESNKSEQNIKTVSRDVEYLESSISDSPKLKTVSSRVVDLFESSSEIPTPPPYSAATSQKLKSTSRLVDLFSSSSEIPTPPQAAISGTNIANLISVTDSSSGIPTPPQPATKTRGTKAEILVHDGHDCLKTLGGFKRQSSFRENWKDSKKEKKKFVYSTSLSIEDTNYGQLSVSPTRKPDSLQVPQITTDCPQHSISPTKSAQVKQNLLRATHFPASDIRHPICRHHSISPVKDLERKRTRLRSEYSLDNDRQLLQIPLSPTQKKRSSSHSDYLTAASQIFVEKKRSNSHSDYLELKEFQKVPIAKIRSSSYSDYYQTDINPELVPKKRSSSHSEVIDSPRNLRRLSVPKAGFTRYDCLLTDDQLIPRECLQHPLSPTPVLSKKDFISRRFSDERQDSSEDFHLTLSPIHTQIQHLSIHPKTINIQEPISPEHATILHISPDPEYLLPTDAIQKSLSRKNSSDEYYSLPIDALVTDNRKQKNLGVELCPKHLSPQNSLQVPGSLPPERKFDRQLSQEECLQILPPPLEYSPRSCRHKDQISVDRISLTPSPKREHRIIKCPSHDLEPESKDLLDIQDIKLSPPAQFSPRSSYRKKENNHQVSFTDTKLLSVEDLELPPPVQFSPRSSTRRKISPDRKKLSIEDLPPPQFSPRSRRVQLPPLPVEFSPRRSRSQFWDSYITDSVATLSTVKPVRSLDEVPIQTLGGKANLSPTRLEQFLSQAVSVQSTLVPIKPPKSAMIGLGVHQHLEKKSSLQEPECKKEFSPRPRRFSLHGSCVRDPPKLKEADSKVAKKSEVMHAPNCALYKASFSEKSTETNNPEICSCQTRPTKIHSQTSSPNRKTFIASASLDVKDNKYNITAMVSPRQLENSLKPNLHSMLQPRRSWQEGVHQPDYNFSLKDVALSPIWLPKQPLEPPVGVHKPKKTKNRPKLSESLSVEIPLSPYVLRKTTEKSLLQPVTRTNTQVSKSIGVNVALSPRSATSSPKKSLDVLVSDNRTLSWQDVSANALSSPQKAFLDYSDENRAKDTKNQGTQCP